MIVAIALGGFAGCGSSKSDAVDAPPGNVKDADGSDAAIGNDGSAGAGTCLSPQAVALGFHTDASASTAAQLDVTAVACATVQSLPERVYQTTLGQPTTVHFTASDHSGQGIGIQVRSDTCMGTSVKCTWSPNGNIDETLALPAGTWLFVVERNPPGLFTFALMQ